jgi:hypothetical protein
MGHIKDMTTEQKSNFIAMCYQRKKEANIGYNFTYFNQGKWDELEKNGYKMYLFKDSWKHNTEATTSVLEAKKIVKELRQKKNYARIICGYIQTQQKEKHYTVIYKSKCNEKT